MAVPPLSPAPKPPLSVDDAVRWMRAQPGCAELVRDAYLGPDLEDSARRFAASGEFAATLALLGGNVVGARVLDLGAGTGIASRAFLQAGAALVIAVEPDGSDLVGGGALDRLCAGLPIERRPDFAESLSLPDASVDLVYARQVLHHTRDLDGALRECARVLRPGGRFLAAREHVVDDDAQLRAFLTAHPMHRLAGGEHAFPAASYRRAIIGAGLRLVRELGPWDSVINAFPAVADDAGLASFPRRLLERKWGGLGRLLAGVPGAQAAVRRWLRLPRPGRMHSYLAVKPAADGGGRRA